jgi:hypothetical protein
MHPLTGYQVKIGRIFQQRDAMAFSPPKCLPFGRSEATACLVKHKYLGPMCGPIRKGAPQSLLSPGQNQDNYPNPKARLQQVIGFATERMRFGLGVVGRERELWRCRWHSR